MLFKRAGREFLRPALHQARPIGQLRQLYTFSANQPTKNVLQKTTDLNQEIRQYCEIADDDLNAMIHQKLRSLWTYHSNAIEGSTLSLSDTLFFLQEGITVGGKPLKDFLDAKNHAKAIGFMYEVVTEQRPIDPHFIKYINSILLSGGVDSTRVLDPFGNKVSARLTPGDYKKAPDHILQPDGMIAQDIEPYLVQAKMRILFEWLDTHIKSEHPVITAAIAHYNMIKAHPFDDGNGKGARILMNLILLREAYMPAIIRIEDRKEYIDCLTLADKGDINPFVSFVAKSLLWTQKAVLEDFKKHLNSNSHTPKFI